MAYREPAKLVPEYKPPLFRWNHWKRWLRYKLWLNEPWFIDTRRFYMNRRQRELGLFHRDGRPRTYWILS